MYIDAPASPIHVVASFLPFLHFLSCYLELICRRVNKVGVPLLFMMVRGIKLGRIES